MKKRRGNLGISMILFVMTVSVTLSVLSVNSAAEKRADKFLEEIFDSETLETVAYLYAADIGRQIDATVITAPLNPFEDKYYACGIIEDFLQFEKTETSQEIKSFLNTGVADGKIRGRLIKAADGAVMTLIAEPRITTVTEDGIDMFPLLLEINIKTKKISLKKRYKFALTAKFEETDELKITVNRGEEYEPIYDARLQIS